MVNVIFMMRILRDKRGVTAIEYALIAALIAVVIIGGVNRLGKSESKVFKTVEKTVKKAV
jgi:pilus assembly protein Flp/PilA